jgi:hypothetical protein
MDQAYPKGLAPKRCGYRSGSVMPMSDRDPSLLLYAPRMSRFGPPDTPGWTVLGGRSEGDSVPELPTDLWDLDWRSTGNSIRVTDPIYGNQWTLWIVEVESHSDVITFAVDEVSNGVYLFAVPRVP